MSLDALIVTDSEPPTTERTQNNSLEIVFSTSSSTKVDPLKVAILKAKPH